jgi:hypothetical protein
LDIIFKVSIKKILKKRNITKKILTHIKRKEKKSGEKERKNYSPLPPKGISVALKTTNLFKLEKKKKKRKRKKKKNLMILKTSFSQF